MKAAYIEQTGPPDVIRFGELPDPVLSAGEVLVRTEAASVNPIDCYARSGLIAGELPKPWIPGRDVAGVVAAIGPGASRFAPGDRVWATNQGFGGRQGTNAGLCLVREPWLYHRPDGIPAETAAAAALVGVTAHLGLVQRLAIRAGESLLVRGAGGAVGSTVIQLATALGTRVTALAGDAAKVAAAQDDGAVMAVDYHSPDLVEQLRQATPDGFDAVWDTTREPDFGMLVPLMAERGRMVLMAGRDAQPPFPVGPFYVKQCTLFGIIMLKMTAAEMQAAADDINAWLLAGALRPRIAVRLPMSQTADAHRIQEAATLGLSGVLAGKIVLFPD